MKFVVTFRHPVYTIGAYKVPPSKPIDAVVISDYTITGTSLRKPGYGYRISRDGAGR